MGICEMTNAASKVFQAIYREGAWGRGSGPGSKPSNTIEYRAFIEANGIQAVTDLGCGDWQFSYLIDWSGIEYLGLDLVPEVIAENSKYFSATKGSSLKRVGKAAFGVCMGSDWLG